MVMCICVYNVPTTLYSVGPTHLLWVIDCAYRVCTLCLCGWEVCVLEGGSTGVADVHVPSVYLPMSCPASSCAFLRRDSRCAVVFVGALLGGSKGGDSMGIVWVAGAFT